MTETRICSRCGTDFEVVRHPIALCGWCECDIRNQRRREKEKAQPVRHIKPDAANRWSVKPIFAWYDLWVGIFWDSSKWKLYILPLPCVGLVIEFPIHGPKAHLKKGEPHAAAERPSSATA